MTSYILFYFSFQTRCDMPYCQTIIAGKNEITRRKNFKKHLSLHFYTVINQPCTKCGLMNQKLGFQIHNQKFYDNFMNFMKTLKSEWTITSRKKGNARKESCVVLKVIFLRHQNGERFHPSIHNLVCSETNS